jgi:hypothetical protein
MVLKFFIVPVLFLVRRKPQRAWHLFTEAGYQGFDRWEIHGNVFYLFGTHANIGKIIHNSNTEKPEKREGVL